MRPVLAFLLVLLSSASDAANAPAPPRAVTAAQHLQRQEQAVQELQRQTSGIVLAMQQELTTLRPRMKAALAGKDYALAGAINGPPSNINFNLDGHDCQPMVAAAKPCANCIRFTAEAFDRWYDRVMAEFGAGKAIIEDGVAVWAAQRARNLEGLTEAGRNVPPPGQWLEDEAAFYRQTYQTIAWLTNFVWSVHVAELAGPLTIDFPGVEGITEVNGVTRYGAKAFPGLLHFLYLDSTLAVFPLQREAMDHRCKREIALDAYQATTGEARTAANQREGAEAALYSASLASCSAAEEAQRDAAVPRFRVLRDRIFATRARLKERVNTWRTALIRAHVYPGEGQGAIDGVYGAGEELTLDAGSVRVFYPAFRDPSPGTPRLTLSGAGADISTAVAYTEVECHRASDVERKVKYADVEKEPFNYSMEPGFSRTVRRSVLAVAEGDSP